MKSVLMALSPYWYYLIGEKIKTDELRKTIAKALDWDKTVECYMTKDKKSFERIPKEYQEKYRAHFGKVGMRFTCDRTEEYHTEFYADDNVYQEIRRVWEDPNYDYLYEDFEIIASNDLENLDNNKLLKSTCLTLDELKLYVGYGDGKIFTWHISNLEVYDNPKELGEFYHPVKYDKVGNPICGTAKEIEALYEWDCETVFGVETNGNGCLGNNCPRLKEFCRIKRPPQSWRYVEA